MAPAPRKIFAGPRLKRLRRERQLTQAGMAAELDVSPSYLNLMERNQRPITVQVLIRLTDVYGIDPRDFIEREGEHSAGEMEQILADPLFREAAVPRTEVRDAAENSPALLAAMARLYRAYAAAREASEAGVAARTDRDHAEPAPGESPVDRIRTIMHEAHNHFPELERRGRDVRGRAGARGKRPLLRLMRTSACPPWHPRQGCRSRSWATGCAGTIITAAN
jgi:XRE family transcriptional regulator, fatty acid utilization regulator